MTVHPLRGSGSVECVRRVVETPIGRMTVIGGANGLRAVLWPEDDDRRVRGLAEVPLGRHPTVDAAGEQLLEYFAGERRVFDLVLDLIGTPFQLAVWRELAAIPFGATATYGAIAKNICRSKAVRAVGAANGRNPVSIVLPCHRVIGANGKLVGFAGGLDTKRYLLNFEAKGPADGTQTSAASSVGEPMRE